jgi:hypothetical protein
LYLAQRVIEIVNKKRLVKNHEEIALVLWLMTKLGTIELGNMRTKGLTSKSRTTLRTK